MPGCAGRWRCRNPVAWRYAAGPGLIVGQSGGPPLKSTQIVPYVPVCRPRFPGARVIVGHPRLHLTRMAHDQEKHPKTSRAKRGKSGQVRCAGGAIPPPGPRSRPGRPAGCCRHLPEMRPPGLPRAGRCFLMPMTLRKAHRRRVSRQFDPGWNPRSPWGIPAAWVDPGGDKKLHPGGKPREPQPACVPGVNSGKAVLAGGKLWLALRCGTRL